LPRDRLTFLELEIRVPHPLRLARYLAASAFVVAFAVPVVPVAVAQPPDSARAVVRLETGPNGPCDVAEKTELVRVSKSKQPVVTFVVTNRCAADVVFSIGGFRHATRGQAGDPIQEAGGQRRLQLRAGQVDATLRLRVRPNAVEGEWQYDIRLDDRLVDPKLQIDP
jgi:hypothetical protein